MHHNWLAADPQALCPLHFNMEPLSPLQGDTDPAAVTVTFPSYLIQEPSHFLCVCFAGYSMTPLVWSVECKDLWRKMNWTELGKKQL
jgi:hypothetical protein